MIDQKPHRRAIRVINRRLNIRVRLMIKIQALKKLYIPRQSKRQNLVMSLHFKYLSLIIYFYNIE